MKISESKRQLAQLLIEAGVKQFPEGANWAAQDKDESIWPFSAKPTRCKGSEYWDGQYYDRLANPSELIAGWSQTILSRAEFDQIVAETAPDADHKKECNRCAGRHDFLPSMDDATYRAMDVYLEIGGSATKQTLDQLLQGWRNADDFAKRKQTEADEAAAMRDERWKAVQVRAGEMGVTIVTAASLN